MFLLCPEIRAFQAEVPRGSMCIPVPDLNTIKLFTEMENFKSDLFSFLFVTNFVGVGDREGRRRKEERRNERKG